jgi:hypothetical protein
VAAVEAVVGATKIVDQGPDLDHFVLVVAGEGFTAAEQVAFEDATALFLADLQATAPYDDADVWQKINVYRLDVQSAESGADNPATCGDDPSGYVPAAPETADTYFESSFCTSGTRRLLTLADDDQLMAALDTHVSAWDAAVVVVNHLEYGGSGNGSNGIAVYSLAPTATQIAIHELGHVLGLADEYDDLIDRWPGMEPDEPNATADTSAAKWGSFVTAANLPTWSSTDCSVSNEGVADPEPGAVGAYEGASRYRCGIYRPTHDCMMRHLGVPFCVVCDTHIRDFIANPFHIGPSSSPCFVASAVYGDPGHPDVAALRRWRDRHLEPGARGRPAMRLLAGVYGLLGPGCARFAAGRPGLACALRRFVFGPAARALRR